MVIISLYLIPRCWRGTELALVDNRAILTGSLVHITKVKEIVKAFHIFDLSTLGG